MNFLSHYYLERHHPSPYRTVGALLPDLVQGFNSKLRKSVFNHGLPDDVEHREIFEGIRRHYAADAAFHGSDFFGHYTALIHARLKESALPSVRFRTYFLAHVFLEMLLDRLLVKHYPQLCVELYRDLEAAEPGVLASYFSLIGKPGVYSEFFNNFSRFISGRFLHYYSDNEMFVKALLRVYQKVNPADASRDEQKIMMSLADELETVHRQKLLGIFEAMSNHPESA